ncbi:hypothetical protein ACWCQW_51020 [Streptomyces mirabilis]
MLQTREPLQSRAKRRAALRSALGAAVLISGISACSGGTGDKEEQTLTASQVCASTLDSSAVTALHRIGNTERFTELPGTDDTGESNKFSLKRAASTIHDDMTQRNQCTVFKAGDKTSHPIIDVDFSATEYHPSTDGSTEDGKSENTIYPIGVYAKTNDNVSATIYFKCSTHGSRKPADLTSYIEANLYSTPDQISTKATGRDLMTVLNAISRGMAKQLGCEAQAALPSQVPGAKAG